MRKLATILPVLMLVVACTDEDGSLRTLDANGFTDIHLTGYQWFACGKDDNFSTGFTAKNPLGKTVSGVVCCGLLKNCTVRF